MSSNLDQPNKAVPRFKEIYDRNPEVSVRAPGRINLIGEHVDYQEGLVLPAAINRYVYGAAAPIPEHEIRIWSSIGGGSELTVPLDQTQQLTGTESWANYVFGVIAKYRDNDLKVKGIELAFDADLPAGSGMSSSAAIESTTALIIESLIGIDLPKTQRALLCQAAEHEYAGVPCGIMDQLSVNCGIEGRALQIDCRSLEIKTFPLPETVSLIVVDSKVKHKLAEGQYAIRRSECETAAKILNVPSLRDATQTKIEEFKEHMEPSVFRRALHVVSEMARVSQFTTALIENNIDLMGILMKDSHDSLRDDFEVSCSELDTLVSIANDLGAIGSRMMGAGFGGTTINLVHSDSSKQFVSAIKSNYRKALGHSIEAWQVSPVGGAARDKN